MTEEFYLLWLSRISGFGIKKQQILLEYFGSARDIYYAPNNLLKKIKSLTELNVHNLIKNRDDKDLELFYKQLLKKNIKFISKYNENYPKLLAEVQDSPLIIYYVGNLPDNNKPKISVIGSRRCSEYGLSVAYRLSRDLAANDVVIVSGMARGIDAQAHRGCIEGGGETVAILGCGVDVCYPSENNFLREKILEKGCIISEYPPETKPIPAYFPNRNRLISGFSSGTIVVEAAERSGTLITVEQALEQGREVFAVPGNITSNLSKGTNALIKEGACLVSDYKDILNTLNVKSQKPKSVDKKDTNSNIDLKNEEKLIYDHINDDPIEILEIVNQTNSQVYAVQYILTMLELKGVVKKLPGQRYVRTR